MHFPPTSTEIVSKRYLAGVLLLTKEATSRGLLPQALGRVEASRFRMLVTRPAVVDASFAAMLAPSEQRLDHFAQTLLLEEAEPVLEAETDVVVLQGKGHLAAAVGCNQEYAPSTSEIANSVADALDLLREVHSGSYQLARECVIAVLDLPAETGQVNAFSNPRLPGFVACSARNAPVVCAEQLLHEGVHTYVWSYLQMLDPTTRSALTDAPGAYSPFTGGARSATRLVHGILSYGAVHALWTSMKTVRRRGLWFGATDDIAALATINARLAVLEGRLRSAAKSLRSSLDLNVLTSFADAMGLGWALANCIIDGFAVPETVSKDPLKAIEGADLNTIEKAELTLAWLGDKVSRVSVPLPGSALFLSLREAAIPYVISNTAISVANDASLGGFSNVGSLVEDIDNASVGANVHVYVARQVSDARQAMLLDREDLAGGVLGIPDCCQRYFEQNWPLVREVGGDLFGDQLARHNGWLVRIKSECNASGMYFGRGLCWHFPCSVDCARTVDTVKRRSALLVSAAQELSSLLSVDSYASFLWSSVSGYAQLSSHEGHIPPKTQWLNGERFYERVEAEITAEEWVWASDPGETRRLVIVE
ncbi:aKG-HExxH-type peptide beta-hydroxylase [Paraburkholderia sp. RL17-347-BIC-D]|uniref:aKG-HExxH-type peptide beta-hydroxylase n=1 Tax=Paraburkholderia sp. RL17-347-BIC-D TaxID=3031632 RepID=UPI0038BA18BA